MFITKIDSPTPRAMAKVVDPKRATTITATMAETRCPPTRLRGWDSGESVAPKRRTAEAPNDPISNG
jgi:hypothetical protein